MSLWPASRLWDPLSASRLWDPLSASRLWELLSLLLLLRKLLCERVSDEIVCKGDVESTSEEKDRSRSVDASSSRSELMVKQHTSTSHSPSRLNSASGAKSDIHPKNETAPSPPNKASSVPCNTILEPVPVRVAMPPKEAANAILRSTAVAALRSVSSE